MIKSFLKDIQDQTGTQLFVLAGFEKTNGVLSVTKYDSCTVQKLKHLIFCQSDIRQNPVVVKCLSKPCPSGIKMHGTIGSPMSNINFVCDRGRPFHNFSFIIFGQTEEGTDDDEVEDDEPKKKKNLIDHIKEHKTGGWPLMPEKDGKNSLDAMKATIQAYVTATYREILVTIF